MTIIQALLIALFGFIGARWSIAGCLAGWWTLGRPLVAGMVIGIILGDVAQGIIFGAAINMLFLGLITVGGVAAQDLNFAAYIGIPLAMVANASVSEAVVLSAVLGALGVFVWNLVRILNVTWIRIMDKQIAEGKLDAAAKVPIYGNLWLFIFRFFPIFLACYLGPTVMVNVMEQIPSQLVTIINIFGGMLPLIGFAIILKVTVKKHFELIYVVLGFVLFLNFRVSVITILVVALVLALIDFKMSARLAVGGEAK